MSVAATTAGRNRVYSLSETQYDEFSRNVSELVYDRARRVVERMLGSTEEEIIMQQIRELMDRFGIVAESKTAAALATIAE